tara:strand:- start:320 stop:523 length:204 start_codon:yes stop_codon:yes gene_type:complete
LGLLGGDVWRSSFVIGLYVALKDLTLIQLNHFIANIKYLLDLKVFNVVLELKRLDQKIEVLFEQDKL